MSSHPKKSAWWLALALPLVAPAVQAAEAENETELDKVEVTGSRIKRIQIEGANPVVSIGRTDIDRAGVSSISEFLQQLTASGSALNTKFNSSGNFGFPPDGGGVGAGSAQVDLRHLDAKRALVLVDGKRWVNESSASGVSSAVDLNTIPLSIVDRIEVLLDGASTVYGTDAIAGVVNVITRKDFNGMDARATVGAYTETGDGDSETYEVSMGKSDAKSSLFFSLAYNDVGTIAAADRDISQEPVPGTGVTRGSSATPQGRFVFDNTGGFADGGLCPGNICDITTPQGATFPANIPSFPTNFIPFSNAERFNFQPYNLVLTPSERTSAFLQGTYELSDGITFYGKFLYNTRSSRNQAAPEPIFLGSDAGNGNVGDHVVFDATNPYNPFGITLSADGGNAFFLTRRPLEGGPRVYTQDVNTFYFNSGFTGAFAIGDTPWDWDLNYIYSRNQALQETHGTYNMAHIVRGVGPLAACTSDPSCVPINFFGGAAGGSLTPDMLDYMLAVLHDTSEQEMRSYSANVSGNPLDLPAGPLGLAFGFEHREQVGSYTPDHLSSSGEANGVPSQPTSGRFSVDEFYGEVVVPLVADAAFAELIEVEASGRFSDYSTSGSTSTFKFGGRWQVNDDFLFRATLAQGFRAPSVGELFGSQARFDAAISDPCSGTGTAIPAECVPFGIPATYQQPNPQISVLTGGNPTLAPEESDSLTWGFVYQPGWAEGLPLTDRLELDVNFYDFTVDGAIQAIDAQTQLDECVAAGPTSPLCAGIDRNINGVITSFNNTLLNIGAIDTTGWDLNLVWRLEETAVGNFVVTWANSFVTDFSTTDLTGVTELTGIERTDSAIPEWTSSMIIDWSQAAWSGAWTMRLIDGVTESCSDFLDGTPDSLTALGLCSDPAVVEADSTNRLGTTVYHDVQLAYDMGEIGGMDTTFKWGVNNLFDKAPPLCLSCSLNGYDASTYDVPGRYMYVAIVGRFD